MLHSWCNETSQVSILDKEIKHGLISIKLTEFGKEKCQKSISETYITVTLCQHMM